MRTLGLLLPCVLASVTGCDASVPGPPETPTCGSPAATPYPPGTPNVAGPTRWYRLAEWRGTSKAFDLDLRCPGVAGCTTTRKRARGDEDKAFEAFDYLQSLCGSEDATYLEYALRLDDVGPGDDPWVPAAIYPLHATPEGWKVDAAALEDGVSLDKPRYRLADGFVRGGTFWSLGPARQKLPLVLPRACYAPTSLDVLVQPRIFELNPYAASSTGRLGAVVSLTDAQTAIDELAHRKAACPLYGVFAPTLAGPDVVAASVEAPNDGVPCDAQSAVFAFRTSPRDPPTGVAPRAIEPFRPSDVCISFDPLPSPPCPAGGCRRFGVRPDGRLDATVTELWPDRTAEPPLPADTELALACATLAACLPLDDLAAWEGRLGAWPSIAAGRAAFAAACASPKDSDGSYQQAEQHAVPLVGSSVRLAALMPLALSAHGDCSMILAARTRWPGLSCGRSGCGLTASFGPVTCVDDDAHFAAGDLVRHCASSLTKCSPTSPTGCTDRREALCPEAALDRCDGNVHLGCNGSSEVTFLDCGRYGGTCLETGLGAKCHYPYAKCALPTCADDVLVLCTRGSNQLVDCKAAGFSGCREGRCVP